MENIEIFSKILDYGLSVGIVLLVAWFLNKKNTILEEKNLDLIEKMHHKDLENLKTLEAISRILDEVKTNGNENTKEIKEYISERTKYIEEEIRRYGN
jgi:hypothetical protein